MNAKSGEIILVNQLNNERLVAVPNLQMNDIECFMYNPVDLYNAIDRTKFEGDPDVINTVYSILFDAFVISRKKLVCYWLGGNYSDDTIFELRQYCQFAQVKLSAEER